MQIKMLRSEVAALKIGVVRFLAGEVYTDVEPEVVASLVGRGYAYEITAETEQVLSREILEQMTVAELRKRAQLAAVPQYNLLRKSDLLEALAPSALPLPAIQPQEA